MATQYNQVVVNDIDIIDTYKKLMEASTGQGSAYLRAKETLIDMYKSVSMTDKAKADSIAQTISSIAINATNQSMEMAYKLETGKRDAVYALTKLKEDTRLTTAQVAKVETDIANATADKDLKVMTGWKAQAELYRDYGVSSWNYTLLPTILPTGAYSSYGIKVETIKMSQANVYNGYATAYRQNGVVLPVIDASTGWLTNATTSDDTGLSYWQTKVSKRQEKGFDDNMRQHVANSSATMVSMLLSSEEAALVDDASAALAKWTTAVNYLNATTV